MRNALIVEDHDETRQWWEKELPRLFPGSDICATTTLQEAREILQRKHFWLAIIDINLPDGSGVDLIEEVTQRFPDMFCVVCTIFDDDYHIFKALRAGAQGYLLKDQPRQRQLEQLKEILHGQPPLSPGIARRILRFLSQTQPPSESPPKQEAHAASNLTVRETEILRLIAKGYSRPEVAKLLDLSLNTVSTYTKSIYQKLDITRRAEAVVEAVRLGLIKSD